MDGFTNLQELYDRVKPALKSKTKELSRLGVDYVKEVDIWNYLKTNIWYKKRNLTLGELVNDIMTVDNTSLEKYVQNIMAQTPRTLVKDDKDLL